MAPMLVKKHSVEELAARIKSRSVISKERVITEMVTEASDPDIVATSTVMSLKDPISGSRIKIPCRSSICKHNACFDVASFLQLQEQAPTWTCPICQKAVSFEILAVDQYFQDILETTPRSVDQVTIEPDGNWSHGGLQNGHTGSNGVKDDADDDDSDDLVDITDVSRPAVKTEAANTPLSFKMLPSVPSPGSAASVPRAGQKRKSEVIDLTLSDDDEPPAKRTAYDTPNSLPGRVDQLRNGYPSFSRTSSSNSLPTNPLFSFQQLARNSFGGNTSSYTSPATHHQTALAGSPLAPITISSPPSRPSPARQASSGFSNALNYQQQQPSQHSQPHERQGSSSGNNPAQRAALLGLARGRSFNS